MFIFPYVHVETIIFQPFKRMAIGRPINLKKKERKTRKAKNTKKQNNQANKQRKQKEKEFTFVRARKVQIKWNVKKVCLW